MWRLSVCLPRKVLLTLYKSFVRRHLDYSDNLFHKPDSENFYKQSRKL